MQTDFNDEPQATSHFKSPQLHADTHLMTDNIPSDSEERNTDDEQTDSGREHVAAIVNSWTYRDSELEHIDEVEGEYIHEPAYSKMMMPGDIDNSILVDFNGEQFMQRIDELASTTVVHFDLYLQWKREKEPLNNWNSESLRRYIEITSKPLNVPWKTEKIKAYGPLKLNIMVEGNDCAW